MDRTGAKLWPEAQSRSRISLRVNSTSQSGSGAVMMTSQTSSTTSCLLLLELADYLSSLVLSPSQAAPPGHDLAVVAQADPSTGHADAVGMHDEVHGALGTDGTVAGGVPPHEDFVVPEAKFTAPKITAVLDRPSTRSGFDLD